MSSGQDISRDIGLGEIADRILRAGHEDKIKVRDVVDALGTRSHFMLILVFAGAAATPISGIPGVSMACGLLIALIAAERLALGRDVRLPKVLDKQALDKDKVASVIDKLRPGLDFIDRHTHRRFEALFKAPLSYLPMLVCLISGLTMPFLEFIPFSASIVASGVVFISIAFVTRDGLIALLAAIPYLGIALLLLRVL